MKAVLWTAEDVPTVTYFLVLLHAGPNRVTAEPPFSAHVAFVDSLVEIDAILLGGDFGSRVGGAEAAYLLHTSTRHEAETWAHKDPLVLHGYYVPEVVEWRLVGVTVGAIDPVLRLPK
jgi:uncharacterized protein YciI